jgi:hypothetical protein
MSAWLNPDAVEPPILMGRHMLSGLWSIQTRSSEARSRILGESRSFLLGGSPYTKFWIQDVSLPECMTSEFLALTISGNPSASLAELTQITIPQRLTLSLAQAIPLANDLRSIKSLCGTYLSIPLHQEGRTVSPTSIDQSSSYAQSDCSTSDDEVVDSS